MAEFFIPIESFLDPARAVNANFLDQIKRRESLIKRLNDVFDCLPRPDISFEDGVSQKHITEQQVKEVYESLIDLLESNEDYERMVLYLPFELLPDKKWHPVSKELRKTSNSFRQSYMKAWEMLFAIHDIRANFLDGDVIEPSRRKEGLPRIVKAAHIIPKLVEKGFIDIKYVLELIQNSQDEILRQSIADTFPVLADLGFFNEIEIEDMKKSDDQLVRSVVCIITTNKKRKSDNQSVQIQLINLSTVQDELNKKLTEVETESCGDITEKRKRWLMQVKRQKVIESFGYQISRVIIGRNISKKELASFLAEANSESQQTLVEGIRMAIEFVASTDSIKARGLYLQHKDVLLAIWQKNSFGIREIISKAFRRFKHLGIIDEIQLVELNIIIPKLAGPFSQNLELMEKEIEEIRNMAKSIAINPELSELIYPIVLVFGSCLKGYRESSDIDMAIFIKPGVPFSARTKLHGLLKQPFIEFWVEKKMNTIVIRDFFQKDIALGDSDWTHVLFGAAWLGDDKTILELQQKILMPYLYKLDERKRYLEELERDALQYRLMHKGYEKFYPPYGGIHTPNANEIDGQSVFWDSGYRQLATRIFANRVFLPLLS